MQMRGSVLPASPSFGPETFSRVLPFRVIAPQPGGVGGGLTTATDDGSQYNGGLSGRPFIKDSAVFTLGAVPGRFALVGITNVSFQYGTTLGTRAERPGKLWSRTRRPHHTACRICSFSSFRNDVNPASSFVRQFLHQVDGTRAPTSTHNTRHSLMNVHRCCDFPLRAEMVFDTRNNMRIDLGVSLE